MLSIMAERLAVSEGIFLEGMCQKEDSRAKEFVSSMDLYLVAFKHETAMDNICRRTLPLRARQEGQRLICFLPTHLVTLPFSKHTTLSAYRSIQLLPSVYPVAFKASRSEPTVTKSSFSHTRSGSDVLITPMKFSGVNEKHKNLEKPVKDDTACLSSIKGLHIDPRWCHLLLLQRTSHLSATASQKSSILVNKSGLLHFGKFVQQVLKESMLESWHLCSCR